MLGRLAIIAITIILFGAVPAFAHSDPRLAGGFLAGFTHPLGGPDHLLAMVAVGIWGSFLRRPLIYLLPIVFPSIMALGGALGMLGVPFPPVEVGIACSVLLLGAAIAGGWKAPIWIAVGLVALFGLFHGYAHGLELPSLADPIAFCAGFVLATGLLHVAGIGIGLVAHRPGGRAVLQACGALIAVAGTLFLYRALAA